MSKLSTPRFELRSLYDDGSSSEPELVPVTQVPLDTNVNRRAALRFGGVLGAGVSASLIAHSISARAQGQWKTDTEPPGKKPSTTPPESKKEKKASEPGPLAKVLAHRVDIKTLAISPDGKLLLSGDNTGIAKVWSLPEAKWLHTFRTGGGPIIAADFDNDRHVLTVISSRYVNQWSTDDWKPRPRKKLKAKTKANAAVISRDHGLAILGTTLGELDFLPLDATTKAPAPKKIRGAIHDLLISADGDLLVINASSKVVLYSLPDIKKITSIAATGTGSVPNTIFGRRPIAVSPEERFLAVASSKSFGKEKGKISLWELPDDALQAKLKTLGEQAGPTYSFSTTEAALHKGALAGKEQVKALSFFSGGPFLVAGGKIPTKAKNRRRKLMKPKTPPPPTDPHLLETIWIWSVDARSSLQSLQGNESVTALALDGRDSVLASAGYDGTIMIWDRKDLDGKPGFEFRTFLFDPKAMDKSKKAASFNVVEAHTGQTISYTLPCGSPIPAGAVCTCNCVPGAYTSPVRHRGTGYTYCSCNKVCTCVPICQAHRLLHDDPNIRLMAEQLLLAMGVGELDYMRWAATQSDQRLRRRIGEVMETIVGGAKARISRWPSTHLLTRYLNHPDEVTRIMAAQMVSLGRRARSDILPPHTRRQIVSLLKRSRALHWKNR